jgi:rare lipoprotein A (peptidoglycan hydrolase)
MWGWARMKLRLTYGVPFAALVLLNGATAARSLADELLKPSPPSVVQNPPATQTAAAPLARRPLRKSRVPARIAARHATKDKLARVAGNVPRGDRHRLAETGDPDSPNRQVRAVGPCQIGAAAWYGGHYVGQQTSSGERLDSVHATAAHRSLPLNSLVRVTNLDNGRSVIVKINDRGPVSETLLIDVSPKAAEQLAMKEAGIVRVAIEQVVEVPSTPK